MTTACPTDYRQHPAPQTAAGRIEDWFRLADADAFATTHTCLPFARGFSWTAARG